MKLVEQAHPVSGEVLAGARLEPGAQLEEGDFYASTSGTWQTCPCPGLVLGETDVVWVRPLKA